MSRRSIKSESLQPGATQNNPSILGNMIAGAAFVAAASYLCGGVLAGSLVSVGLGGAVLFFKQQYVASLNRLCGGGLAPMTREEKELMEKAVKFSWFEKTAACVTGIGLIGAAVELVRNTKPVVNGFSALIGLGM